MTQKTQKTQKTLKTKKIQKTHANYTFKFNFFDAKKCLDSQTKIRFLSFFGQFSVEQKFLTKKIDFSHRKFKKS